MRQMTMTNGIQKSLKTLNPYIKVEAETIAWSEGVRAMQNKQVGVFITAMRDRSFTKVKDVDFRNKGAKMFYARVGTTHNAEVYMDVRLGGVDGQLLCTVRIPRTGGSDMWRIVSAEVPNVTGIHDVYFVFRGRGRTNVMHFDYWRFAE